MKLRAAQAGDAAALAGLALQVFLDTYCTEGLRADLTAEALATGDPVRWTALLQDPQRRTLLIEHEFEGEAHVVALATLQLSDDAAELERLYLHPRFQRQGLGRRLLRASEDCAREAGARRLWLDCWAGNARALAFYAACNYHDEGAAVYHFGGRDYANRRLALPLIARV